MRIRITKLTDLRHRFEVLRERGVAEAAELETRSLLLHDFLHYAAEEAAGLQHGFYGRLAAGDSLASLSHPESGPMADAPPPREDARQPSLATIEPVVGALTSFAKGDLSIESALERFELAASSGALERPSWVDAAFLERVRARLGQLTGHWKALRHGESLELTWP